MISKLTFRMNDVVYPRAGLIPDHFFYLIFPPTNCLSETLKLLIMTMLYSTIIHKTVSFSGDEKEISALSHQP